MDCEIVAVGVLIAKAIFLPASVFLHPYRDKNLRKRMTATSPMI
ncbi:hypothetical protein RISK_003394 [Rhodopirellula islandica]|uniref:Transmembrane protein n=1 Tax=Rhodopirellula islandica TaxID=595434 RepID=A0A0J1BCH4_RHOIS|nr:hypothetical protein RISK_003394 [Rhodopirellula islandica]